MLLTPDRSRCCHIAICDMVSRMKEIYAAYVASFSGGKDSLAMVLRLMEERYPLTHVVFFDTGMEFAAVYRNVDRMEEICKAKGITFVKLRPKNDWLYDMLLKPINAGKENEHFGQEWCGSACRWRTGDKVAIINGYLSGLGSYVQYMGMAVDEPLRIDRTNGKRYPLVDWKMTEADCLRYCYDHGWNWLEDGVELYSILDRVSCWCCANKNLKECRNYYHHLPRYWAMLKALQSRIPRPFKKGATVFDLEKRFAKEDEQSKMHFFDVF